MLDYVSARARKAHAARRGDPPEIIAALDGEYQAAWLKHYIRPRLPALNNAQRAELAQLIRAGGDTNGDAS